MKKTLLILGMTCVAGSAVAAEYDSRWMLTPMFNFGTVDSAKNLDSAFGAGIGIGKFLNDNWSLDFEVDSLDYDLEVGNGGVRQTGYGLMSRYHFSEGSLRPFLGFGLGYLDHDGSESASAVESSDFMLNVSAGLRKKISDNVGAMAEVVYRLDNDNYTGTQSSYDDYLFRLGLNFALGEAPKAAPAEEIVEPAPLDSDGDGVSDQDDNCPNTPAGTAVDKYGCPYDGDDDNDGVANSVDKCPNSKPGAIVDKDGCAVQVVIELQGVHFDTNKATLKSESIDILNAAVKTLGEHGTILVEIAGHTDSRGSDSYNQKLSERRAKVVYDYLVSKGIAANRMTWNGYGEANPVAPNDTDEGRAKNRRTEMIVKD